MLAGVSYEKGVRHEVTEEVPDWDLNKKTGPPCGMGTMGDSERQ